MSNPPCYYAPRKDYSHENFIREVKGGNINAHANYKGVSDSCCDLDRNRNPKTFRKCPRFIVPKYKLFEWNVLQAVSQNRIAWETSYRATSPDGCPLCPGGCPYYVLKKPINDC